jgi:hypothetical protein
VTIDTKKNGFGIIHLLITAAILTGVAMAYHQVLNNNIKVDARNAQISARLRVFKATADFAASPDVILTSAYVVPTNNALRRCLFSNVGTCNTTNPSAPGLIKLYVPMSQALNMVPVTGINPATDVNGNHDLRGLRANCPRGIHCPFEARVRFYAICPDNTPTCPVSRQIVLIPEVRIHTASGQRVLKIDNYPTKSLLASNPDFGRVTLETSEILRNSIVECPDGAFMSGISATGELTCRCQNGYRQIGTQASTGLPICQAIAQCPTGQILSGVKANGDAFCRTPPATSYTCNTIATPSQTYLSCSNVNSRMRAVQITDECTIDTSNEVHCNFTSITCCEAN